ncbi:MAG TPA: hypothetical protein VFQ92_10170, partial [Blastocatellia bacterium]|nr:hypothetical protein [Blastocatellia bacterium]
RVAAQSFTPALAAPLPKVEMPDSGEPVVEAVPVSLPPPEAIIAEAGAPPADAAALIKKALEERRKMLLLSVLDQADLIELDGNFLCISFPPEKSMFKAQVESRENRKLIEEVCRSAVGRAFTLSVSVGGKAKPAQVASEKPPEATKPNPKAESHPLVQAIVDRFHGEIVEVVDPDPRT